MQQLFDFFSGRTLAKKAAPVFDERWKTLIASIAPTAPSASPQSKLQQQSATSNNITAKQAQNNNKNIFIVIFSFLSARGLLRHVTLACKSFYLFLSDDNNFQALFKRVFPRFINDLPCIYETNVNNNKQPQQQDLLLDLPTATSSATSQQQQKQTPTILLPPMYYSWTKFLVAMEHTHWQQISFELRIPKRTITLRDLQSDENFFKFQLSLVNNGKRVQFLLPQIDWHHLFHLYVYGPKPATPAIVKERWNVLNELHVFKYKHPLQDAKYSAKYMQMLKDELSADLVLRVKDFGNGVLHQVLLPPKTKISTPVFGLASNLKVQSKLYKLYRHREEHSVVLSEAHKQYSTTRLLANLFKLHRTLYFQAVVQDITALPMQTGGSGSQQQLQLQQDGDGADSSSADSNSEQQQHMLHFHNAISNIVAVTLVDK